MAKWFYLKNGTDYGPVDSARLKQLAQAGEIGPDDSVRKEDKTTWTKASKVQGLFSSAPGSVPIQASVPTASPSPTKIHNVPSEASVPPQRESKSNLNLDLSFFLRRIPTPIFVALPLAFFGGLGYLIYQGRAAGNNPIKSVEQAHKMSPTLFNDQPEELTALVEEKPAKRLPDRPTKGPPLEKQPLEKQVAETKPVEAQKLDPKFTKGPNGEELKVENQGSRNFYHYYLDENGKKVMHGMCRSMMNGVNPVDSLYDQGIKLSSSEYDKSQRLVTTYKRIKDNVYEVDKYVYEDEGVIQLRNRVTITKTETGSTETYLSKRDEVISDTTKSLPSVPGRELKVTVDTAGINKMGWWVRKHNASMSAVKCIATEDKIVIDFDVDESQWTPVNQTFPLLVRLFDKNGQYLTHFTTAEGFTPFKGIYEPYNRAYEKMMQRGLTKEAVRNKSTLLKPRKNRFVYSVNVRDLRDAQIVEIGFTERN